MLLFPEIFWDRMVYDTLRNVPGNSDVVNLFIHFFFRTAGSVLINTGPITMSCPSISSIFRPAALLLVYPDGRTDGTFSGQVYVNGTGPSQPHRGTPDYASLKVLFRPFKRSIKVLLPPYAVIYLVADKK